MLAWTLAEYVLASREFHFRIATCKLGLNFYLLMWLE